MLLTGFEPFGPWGVNSSGEAVRLIGRKRSSLTTAVLPVDHTGAADVVRTLIRKTAAEAVLLTGLAAGSAFRLETLARPRPLAAGPAVRRGQWPVAATMRGLRAAGIPVKLSRDAGGYVCDTTYWAALGERTPLCLFVHVPPLGGAWTAHRIARGIEAVLGTVRKGRGATA